MSSCNGVTCDFSFSSVTCSPTPSGGQLCSGVSVQCIGTPSRSYNPEVGGSGLDCTVTIKSVETSGPGKVGNIQPSINPGGKSLQDYSGTVNNPGVNIDSHKSSSSNVSNNTSNKKTLIVTTSGAKLQPEEIERKEGYVTRLEELHSLLISQRVFVLNYIDAATKLRKTVSGAMHLYKVFFTRVMIEVSEAGEREIAYPAEIRNMSRYQRLTHLQKLNSFFDKIHLGGLKESYEKVFGEYTQYKNTRKSIKHDTFKKVTPLLRKDKFCTSSIENYIEVFDREKRKALEYGFVEGAWLKRGLLENKILPYEKLLNLEKMSKTPNAFAYCMEIDCRDLMTMEQLFYLGETHFKVGTAQEYKNFLDYMLDLIWFFVSVASGHATTAVAKRLIKKIGVKPMKDMFIRFREKLKKKYRYKKEYDFEGKSTNEWVKGRKLYEREVMDLERKIPKRGELGKMSEKAKEELARKLHQERRKIGESYKHLTEKVLGKKSLEEIFARNEALYGDKYGPTIEYLRKQGKTWEQIMKGAANPGGAATWWEKLLRNFM